LYRFLAIAVLLDVKDIPQVGPLQWGWISSICTAFDSFFRKFGVYPSDLNDVRLLEFTPNNESFDQLAKNLGFQCFLYKLTSTGTPGIQSGWNFSLCVIFHDGVTEYCVDKTCQVVRTTTSETKDRCPPP
jgi:hypothetical protein